MQVFVYTWDENNVQSVTVTHYDTWEHAYTYAQSQAFAGNPARVYDDNNNLINKLSPSSK